MEEFAAREKVLKSIREALSMPQERPFSHAVAEKDFYKYKEEIPEVSFAEAFKELGGNFLYCHDEKEFCRNLEYIRKVYALNMTYCEDKELINILKKNNIAYESGNRKLLAEADCCLTSCDYLISRTGSVMISAAGKGDRQVYFTAPYHFVVAYTSQLVQDIKQALEKIQTKYDQLPSFISFISGPSRTADIEKTLVMGAHGPKELFLFLIDDGN